jgi:hypothetical protein
VIDARIAPLLEAVSEGEGVPHLRPTPHSAFHELVTFEDESHVYALTELDAHRTLLVFADVDGTEARCTLFDQRGVVLAAWEAFD